MEPPTRLFTHPILTAVAVFYSIGFGIYGWLAARPLTGGYVSLVLVATAGMVVIDKKVHFSLPVLIGLTGLGFIHLAGGLVPHATAGVLYNAPLVEPIHYDHVLHAFEHFVVAVGSWEILTRWFAPTSPSNVLIAIFIAVTAMGFGAIVELNEFVLTLTVEANNVGSYTNTGWDLVANALGTVIGAGLVVRLERRRALSSDVAPATPKPLG